LKTFNSAVDEIDVAVGIDQRHCARHRRVTGSGQAARLRQRVSAFEGSVPYKAGLALKAEALIP